MRVLLGPTNYANQPMALTRALQRRGIVDAAHVTYAWDGRVELHYDRDEVVELDRGTWLGKQLGFVDRALERGVDVFHLWHRSLVHEPGGYGFFAGLDLPYLKAAGATVVYRFTGYELRRRSLDMEVNPYSPFHRGYTSGYDEQTQALYLDHLREWVDCFVVQDPEMRTFLPEAECVPRGVDLSAFEYVGVEETVRPLIVHAPSRRELKGSEAILEAIEHLRERRLSFDFKLIEGMSHAEAVGWYRRADIVVDQLLIGWYGSLAVEAMALGKPLVAYVREPLRREFEPALPVVNATVDDIADQLAALVEDPARRVELGRRSRAFAEEVHDIEKVAEQAEALYRRVTGAEIAERAPRVRYLESVAARDDLANLRHDAARYHRFAEALPELRQKARRYDRIVEELPDLRRKARNWDRIAGELPRLRFKAAQYDGLNGSRNGQANAREPVPIERRSGPSLRVCIVSRKRLDRVTRVVRQAKALSDAGHTVTVLSFTRPCDELVATTPEVEYVELRQEPWTREFLLERNRRAREKRTARLKRERRGRRNRAAGRLAAAVRRPLWYLFVAVPSAALLKLPGERLRDRARELAGLEWIGVLRLYLLAISERANTSSFADRACEAMRGRTFDCCQAHDNYALLPAQRLAEQSGAQLFYDAVEIAEHRVGDVLRGRSRFTRLSARYERRAEAKIIRSAHAVTAIGDGLADWYAGRYRIPRPVPVRNCRYFWPYARREDIRRDCGAGPDDRVVTWFGHAYPAQGLDALIAAARYVDPRTHFALMPIVMPAWKEFFAALMREVDDLGLASRIHVLEPRDPNDLISYVSGADAGILPLRDVGVNMTYSMPNKLMEMIMARLPVAISGLPEIRSLVERYGIGEVFDVDDPLDIALTLELILEPDTQARMRAAVMRAAEELSWENEARAYLSLFEPPLTPPRSARSSPPSPPARRAPGTRTASATGAEGGVH